jgi:hypothetical protein
MHAATPRLYFPNIEINMKYLEMANTERRLVQVLP